ASGSMASHSRASAPPPTSTGKRHAEAAHTREKVASAAARMADATRQVGSLVYMAPELVLSGNYNEKASAAPGHVTAVAFLQPYRTTEEILNTFRWPGSNFCVPFISASRSPPLYFSGPSRVLCTFLNGSCLSACLFVCLHDA
ncbi:hypothetical protein Vretimale_11595, partial [Volvox reticuliferus]